MPGASFMSHSDTFLVARSPAVVCLFARKNSHRRILHSWNTVSPVGLYVLPLKNSQVTAVDDLRKYIFQKVHKSTLGRPRYHQPDT